MPTLDFSAAGLTEVLADMSDAELGELEFGVIAFDAEACVRRYSSVESAASGLSPERVLGKHLFNTVAPCMNNFMVAQQFEDAATLDITLNYVLTLRMKPVKVRLRLLAVAGLPLRYVLINRRD